MLVFATMSADRVLYLDSSAIVKLAVREPLSQRRFARIFVVGGLLSVVRLHGPRLPGRCYRSEKLQSGAAKVSSVVST